MRLYSFYKTARLINKSKAHSCLPAGRLGVWGVVFFVLVFPCCVYAQGDARVGARIDAKQITVGDQARLFIDVQNNPATTRLQWAVIPDTFDHLEVVEKGKIDTIKQGNVITYRQRLLITGFDSGVFKIPAFVFAVIPSSGTAYTIQTDSFALVVQTVPVDTTKAFKPIKGIIFVKSTWMDYLGLIIGSILFILLFAYVIIYFIRNKKAAGPKPKGPGESLQDYTLRLLADLEKRQLWQKKQVKGYYVELTDIVRNYLEMRFKTQVLELTTDELLNKAELLPDLQRYHDDLSFILQTADLAKFAKAEPLPQEHMDAMEKAKQFVDTSRPVVVAVATENTEKTPASQSGNDDSKAS